MKNPEDRQRDMREHQPEMTKGTQHDAAVTLIEILEKIKAAPLKTAEEHMAVMLLIDKAKRHLDPMEVFLLQIQAILKHYALNKRPEDPEMTLADALLLRERSKLSKWE
jgi:2,3-bisphosphoglycerate-independent phosphoglycerate mutase